MKANNPNGGGKYTIMAEINMVPLIDVALVLLIIFMVMTPYLVKNQIKINLPRAKATEETPPRQEIVEVQIEKSGVIYIDGRAVTRENVEKRLREILPQSQERPVMIQADKDVPFQYVVVVMDAAKRLGVAKLGVNVKPEFDLKSGPKTP